MKFNIFLIANNKTLKKPYINTINQIKINDNDKIIRFNHCSNLDIFNKRVDAIAIRNNATSYWGINSKYVTNVKNKKIYLLGKNDDTDTIIDFFKKSNNSVTIINYNKNEYSKTDSSGKQIIDYFRNNKNINKIYLVGFNFHNETTEGSHNFQIEKKKVLQYDNVILL